MQTTIPRGLYLHYKGNDYYLFQIAHHSETDEPMAVYQCLYGDYSWGVRPLAMFLETVEREGRTIPRFEFVRALTPSEIATRTGGSATESPSSTEIDLLEDERWMRRAMALAEQGEQLGEVPVGAVIVSGGEVLGEGFNQPITRCDPTAHAEVVALRNAAAKTGNYRLLDATLYVTLEPCTMCVGALVHARIARLVFATTEPKAGGVVSQSRLLEAGYFNHRVEYQGGVCAGECQQQLSAFFRRRREELKQTKAIE